MTPAESTDAFHRGGFSVVQPVGRGHRSGVDAMIIAACVPIELSGPVADFGSGSGAAGLAVAARCKNVHVTLVERDAEMAQYARRTLALEANVTLAPRLAVLEADVCLSGKSRVNSGLCERMFDQVIMNPPFNAAHDRATPDVLKAGAHVMEEGLFESWLRSAAAVLKPQGKVAIIARPASLNDILTSCDKRFGGLRIVPIQPRPNEPAIRIVLTGIRGSRAGLSLEPPLVLHGESGNEFLARANAIINGSAGLFDSSLQRSK
jgi:tRNA1(Val) A37 N6-methylase TrmN6